ncbi:universal stress protein [Streptosporangium sp. DT93]|uniref:universal stress protein n=1 Tax=Streptosporangium sp. DT93 TaxID=3393428 RepID=UPI003CF63DDD
MHRAPPSGPRIIVGVNDTPGARWALAWALGESRLRHLPVHLIHAYQETTRLEHQPWFTTIDAAAQVAAADMLARVLREVADGQLQGVKLSASVRPGRPGVALTELTRSTDLLIVGRSRRRVPILSAGVTAYCQKHAKATVITVATPPPPDLVALSGERGGLWRRLKGPAGSPSGEQ